jgi:hypothetical protein
MGSREVSDHVTAFTEELLSTGLMLAELGSNLAESLPADAYPGEEPGAVVAEMITGTIHTALGAVDGQDLARATQLIAEARDRVLDHLQLALALSRRMHEGGVDGPPRTYG